MFKRIKLLFSKISQKDFGSGGDGFGTSVFERVTNFLFGGSQKKYVNQYKGWVFACVDAASKEVGNIKLELFKRKANGEVEQIFQSPVLDLLFKVNSTTTFFQLMQATEAFLELTGNAYWWIRDNKEIQMLHPSTTYFVLDSDDISLENIPKIKEWVTKVAINGRVRTLRIPAEKVIAFKAFNPMAETLIPSKGMGTVEAAIISIQQDVQSNLWNLNFFKNSARPDLALEAEGAIPKEQKEKLRKAWEQEFKGTSKSHRVAILEGLKLNKVNFSQKEMDFVDLKKITMEEILALFRTPKSILGMVADSNRSNTKESDIIYNNKKINPDKQRIVDHLNEFLLPMLGEDDLFFKFKKTEIITREEQLNKYDNGTTNRWLTVNEIRREEGLKEVEGGDVLVMPNMDETVEVKKFVVKNYIPTRKKFDKEGQDRVHNFVKRAIGKKSRNDTELETLFKDFVLFSDKEIEQFRVMTVSEFNKQEKRVLGKIKKPGKKSIGEDLARQVFNIKEEAKIFARNSLTTYFKIVEEGAAQAIALARAESDFVINETMRKEIERRAAEFFGESVNNTTFNSLSRQLNIGIREGDSIDQLIDRIKGVFLSAKISRALTIARTEALNAINVAQLEVYNQDKDVEELQWIATLDNRVRDAHRKLHGVVIKKGSKFTLAGRKIDRPQDSNLPAAESINCRCSLAPIVSTLIR